jgi:hypothetical protein
MAKTPLAKEIAQTLRKKRMTEKNLDDKLSPGEATALLAAALQSLPSSGQPTAEPPAAQAPATASAPAPAAATKTDKPEPSVVLNEWLKQILSTRRRHESQGDFAFRKWLIDTLKSLGQKEQIIEGNIVVTVKGKGKKESTTLFSCHIDTCHSLEESTGQRQSLCYDSTFNHLFLNKLDAEGKELKNVPGCLGADDGAGVYVLLRMIKAKVPGTYIFHIGEEVGCIGSRAMASKQSTWLSKFTHAIAFDRQGTQDIIITQGGQVCASTECGMALADAINACHSELDMEISHKGVLTDVKHYAFDIPECINVAVGYDSQHGSHESLDVGHLERLVDACVKIDWAKLPVKRMCAARFQSTGKTAGGYGGYGGYGGLSSVQTGRKDSGFGASRNLFEDERSGRYDRDLQAAGFGKSSTRAVEKAVPDHPADWLMQASREDILAWLEEQPEEAAKAVYMLVARCKGMEQQIETLEDFM